jgi:DNA-binding NtrC family response regulator
MSMGALILVSGLSEPFVERIANHVSVRDCQVKAVKGSARTIAAARKESPRLVVLGSPGHRIDDGLDQVRRLKALDGRLPIIMISQKSSEKRAVAAFRAGVDDYFKATAPFDHILKRINGFLRKDAVHKRVRLQKPTARPLQAPEMIAHSPAMLSTRRYLKKVAEATSTVLITGETGTGKELAARWIHFYSARRRQPLVLVNCAALPESLAESEMFGHERGAFTGAVACQKGKFVQANGGTIFLDEIGDMDPFIQAKILHTIERKVVYPLGSRQPLPLDVRIIAATNQDPERLMQDGRFRKDLFYRLNIARVNLAPLRKRKEDIPGLVDHAIAQLNRRFNRQVAGLAPDAMAFFQSYRWPGNVRQLMNLLEAAFINQPKDTIAYHDLPAYFRDILEKTQDRPFSERQSIVHTLLETNWNKSRAAQKLNWSRMTLYRKMARYKIVEGRNR